MKIQKAAVFLAVIAVAVGVARGEEKPFYVVTWNQYETEWHWFSDEGYCSSPSVIAVGCQHFGVQGFNTVVVATHTAVFPSGEDWRRFAGESDGSITWRGIIPIGAFNVRTEEQVLKK